jgi:predicted sugar kinase
MLIEIGAPACLPLGLVKQGNKRCLLGLTLQHPPVHLFAESGPELRLTGPRADKGYEQAVRLAGAGSLTQPAAIEIELAIPALMGLGSDVMLGLSVGRALAWVNGSSLDDSRSLARDLGLRQTDRLALEGFEQGGLLLVDLEASLDTPPLRRKEIAHPEKDAWAFVFYFPHPPDNVPDSFEADRLETLLQAGPHLSEADSNKGLEALWQAVEEDDFEAFGLSLMAIQAMNHSALEKERIPVALTQEERAICDLMQAHGAVVWGRTLTGYALYGLVRGAKASIDIRTRLRKHVGYFGGTIMATITDNRGARHIIRDETLATKFPRPYV